MRALRLLVPVLLLALLGERRAAADPSTPPVFLEATSCAVVPASVLRRMVSAELGEPLAQEADQRVTRLVLTCTGQLALIELRDPVTGKLLVRQIDLPSHASDTTARLLALSMVELIAASWVELAVERERALPGLVANLDPPSPPQQAAARDLATRGLRRRDGWRFSLLGGGRWLAEGAPSTPGAAVQVDRIWRESLVVSGDVSVNATTVETALGKVRVGFASMALTLGLRQTMRALSIEAGAGARFGVVRAQGVPASPDIDGFSFVQPWWGPLATCRIVVQPWSRLALSISGELGVTFRDVIGQVEGQPVLELRGPWSALLLGAGVTFD